MKSYIPANEFLALDPKIQKVFIDWWKPKVFDLCSEWTLDKDILTGEPLEYWEKLCIMNSRKIMEIVSKKVKCIPLLQIHHLIEFIEEHTSGKLDLHIIHGVELIDELFKIACNRASNLI